MNKDEKFACVATWNGESHSGYFWREDDDLIFQDADTNEVFKFTNTYPVSIGYGELESEPNESVTLVGNNKIWKQI